MSRLTHVMEKQAKEMAINMARSKGTKWPHQLAQRNTKPWYSPRWMFDPSTNRVLIGTNPGGEPLQPDDTTSPKVYEKNLNCPKRWNAYIDEAWGDSSRPGEAKMQKAVRVIFQKLYGCDPSETALRETACFNACPFRTSGGADIPVDIWRRSACWMLAVLEHVRPTTIICNGNKTSNRTYRSAWAALILSGLEVREEEPIPVGDSYEIRFGVVAKGTLKDCRVLGLPHLSARGLSLQTLYRKLAKNRCAFKLT